MILDLPPADHLLRSKDDRLSRKRVDLLIERFSFVFPEIVFDVLWETDTCNAQAFMRFDVRHVRVYGGLSRHRYVGSAGLAFALAHETGHHLAGLPLLTYHPCLSSEEAANAWATDTGLVVAFGVAKAKRYGHEGPRQLARAYYSLLSRDPH